MSLFIETKKTTKDKIYPSIVLLGKGDLATLVYHDIFDYPLTPFELIKWTTGEKVKLTNFESVKVTGKDGFLFLTGKGGLVLKRLMRKRASARKIAKAKKAVKILSLLPTIKMIAVTGALAMQNSSDESDIDFMVITRKGTLWTTRLLSLVLLDILRIPRRRYGSKDQKDKLCLNIWLDENNLVWRKRNIFTAHEIAQVEPLVNKDETYERFIYKNKWIKDFWPNAVVIKKITNDKESYKEGIATKFVEHLARRFQYWYMKDKITREVVTPTRALFHPVDWGTLITSKLKIYFE